MPYGIKTIFQTKIDETSDTDIEEIGTIRWEGEKVYKWVKGVLSTTMPRYGSVAAYYDDDYDDSLVTSNYADSDNLGAGVWQANFTNSQHYGWIQIKGPCVIPGAVTDGAAGNAMTIVGAGNRTLDVMASVTSYPVATLLDATAPITKGACYTVQGSKVISMNSTASLVVGDTVFGSAVHPIAPFSVIVSIDAVAKTITMDKAAVDTESNVDIVFCRQKIMCDFPF